MLCMYVGSFDNVPAYDPSATSCTDVTTSTLIKSTQTVRTSASEAPTGIISWTTISVQTTTSHVQSPSPTSSGRPADGAQDHFIIRMIVIVSVATGLLIIIVAAVIIYAIVGSVRIHV